MSSPEKMEVSYGSDVSDKSPKAILLRSYSEQVQSPKSWQTITPRNHLTRPSISTQSFGAFGDVADSVYRQLNSLQLSPSEPGIIFGASTPLEIAARTSTPLGIVATTSVPLGIPARTNTPLGITNRTSTPLGSISARTSTPLRGLSARTSTPLGITDRTSSPLSMNHRRYVGALPTTQPDQFSALKSLPFVYTEDFSEGKMILEDSSSDVSMHSENKSHNTSSSVRAHSPMTAAANSQEASNRKNTADVVSFNVSRKSHNLSHSVFLVGFILSLILGIYLYSAHTTCTLITDDHLHDITLALQRELFGQHLVLLMLPAILQNFLRLDGNESVLVVSFHGWTGVGKNLVADTVSRHLHSDHVVPKIVVPLHFPPSPDAQQQLNQVQLMTSFFMDNQPCLVNAFVLDEVDKTSMETLQALVQVLQLLNTPPHSAKKTVVFLLSNEGGGSINEYVYKALLQGKAREDISSQELIKLISQSDNFTKVLADANIVNHVIPFLPLEKHHVTSCISVFLEERGKHVPYEQIDQLANEFPYYQMNDGPLLSQTGCKRVASKISLHLS